MKTSDDGVAAGLLTATAREETGKHGMAVQPPGSPNAEYEVTAVRDFRGGSDSRPGRLRLDRERHTTGPSEPSRSCGCCARQSEGWRVFGMGTQMPSRTDPVFFNFEDPEGMSTLLEDSTQEMAAMATEKTDSGEDECSRDSKGR